MIEVIPILIISIFSLMLIVFAFAFGLKKHKVNTDNHNKFVSVIVAFRNEATNLTALIESLLKQNYSGRFEVILVNDNSEDNYKEIIARFFDEKIKVYDLPVSLQGKKHALRYAVSKAKGEIFVFTDADCIVKENWLSDMLNQMQSGNFKMICGPVEFLKSKSIFSPLFQLEFLSLTGSGAAGIFIKKAFMCNGANYAVYCDVMNEALQNINDKYSSGDDVFLLHYLSSKHKVGFVKSYDAIVETNAPQSIAEFFNQRIRWASKASGYSNPFAIFVAVITFLTSLVILVVGIAATIDYDCFKYFLVLFIIKLAAELIFMLPICSFYRKQSLILYLPVLEIVHPIYIVLTALLSLFNKPKWKGRKIT